ncbi:MAG: metallophosphoesterase family protein [Verrucomicrobiae bacterium]|nr:metallophosphoesterase family protein [Verrucomicrobiae bacterium]
MEAIVSDIHGNLEALQAVLEDIDRQNIKRIVSLGDAIGYGPDPAACLQLVMDRCEWSLCGNHEYVMMNRVKDVFNPVAEEAINWTREQITDPNQLEYLKGLEPMHRMYKRLYVHGSARNPLMEYVYEAENHQGFLDFIQKIDEDLKGIEVCFTGHNHRAFLGTPIAFLYPHENNRVFHVLGQKAYVCVGSVGQPRDDDPRSCYVTYDGEKVEYHRVNYDIKKTAEKIKKAGLPSLLSDRLYLGV